MGRIHDALRKAESERLSAQEDEKVPVYLRSEASRIHPAGPPHAPVVLPTNLAEELIPEPIGNEVEVEPAADSFLYSQRKDGTLGVHQLRMLQVNLSEMQSRQRFKRLLITSATEGEGKTHVAANLAWTLASDGDRKVLLVDADMQKASVHSVCGIPNENGLKDLLLNVDDLWKTIRKVKGRNLYIMTGGGAAYETVWPSCLSRLQPLLEQLAPAFDLVILDSAPLLGRVDTKLLSAVADAVLLVVRAGITSRDLVMQAQELLEGQNVLGVILNGLDPRLACFATYHSYGAR